MPRDQRVVRKIAAIVQYEGLKYADDDSDARWLAKLLRLGPLPEGYIYPKGERPVRDLLRKRSQPVRQRTGNIHSIQNLMARNRGHSLGANRIKRLTDEEVDGLLPDPDLAPAVKNTLAAMRTLDGAIDVLKKRVKARIKLRPAFKPLPTVSGIGEIPGLTVMLGSGETGRFAKVGNYASYCRCVGSEHLSNGKRKGRGNAKNGNKYLAWAYIEAASFSVRYNPRIKRYYQRKCARTHPVAAIKTVAHKLTRARFYILRDQVPFDVNKAFT